MKGVRLTRPFTVTVSVVILFIFQLYVVISTLLYHKGSFDHLLHAKNIYIFLNILIVYFIFKGERWARALYLLLYIITLLLTIPSYMGIFKVSTSAMVINSIGLFVQFIALIMLFSGSGKVWFSSD